MSGQNTGVACYFPPQGIFPTQGSLSPALVGRFFPTSATWMLSSEVTSPCLCQHWNQRALTDSTCLPVPSSERLCIGVHGPQETRTHTDSPLPQSFPPRLAHPPLRLPHHQPAVTSLMPPATQTSELLSRDASITPGETLSRIPVPAGALVAGGMVLALGSLARRAFP